VVPAVGGTLIGEECPGSVEGTNYFPLNITADGWHGSDGGYTADGCSGRFRWHTTDGSGQDTFTWQFDTGKHSGTCSAALYIPASSTYADATSVPYTANVGGKTVDGRPIVGGSTVDAWTVNQKAAQGKWVTKSFTFTGDANGRVSVIMADNADASARYVVAGPVRLTCS
jgi:hypothetical protein